MGLLCPYLLIKGSCHQLGPCLQGCQPGARSVDWGQEIQEEPCPLEERGLGTRTIWLALLCFTVYFRLPCPQSDGLPNPLPLHTHLPISAKGQLATAEVPTTCNDTSTKMPPILQIRKLRPRKINDLLRLNVCKSKFFKLQLSLMVQFRAV